MDLQVWLSRYTSIISGNSEGTFASFRTSMMVLIELWSWSKQPGSLHLMRCFKFSYLHPHWGLVLMMFSSQSKSIELQLHQPDTCLMMNERNILGYLEKAQSYPSHQTESKWTNKTIPFLLKKILAVKQLQNSSSSDQRDPVTFFPPHHNPNLLIWKNSFYKFPGAVGRLQFFFASLSTLMLMHSYSVQSCHFFVSSACDCMYLNMTRKGWTETRCLKSVEYISLGSVG